MGQTGQVGQGGPDLHAQFRPAEIAPLAVQQGAGSAPQVESRTCQAQGIEAGNTGVLKNANAHKSVSGHRSADRARPVWRRTERRAALHSTVTLLAKFRGLSTSRPRSSAM